MSNISHICSSCNETFQQASQCRESQMTNSKDERIHKWSQRKVARLFCENSSMRGVNKLVKHNSLCLHILWILFLITMTLLLMYGTLNLILQYGQYGTIINTREEHGETTEFPSITICNHHPFKDNAARLWNSDAILSPRNFSQMVRDSIKSLLMQGKYEEAKTLFANDDLDSYYETIGRQNAKQIGHDRRSIIYCLLSLKTGIRVGHPDDCGIDVKLLQHPQFFNCYIINVKPAYSSQTVSLGLIVHVGKEPNSHYLNRSFIQEAFHQSHGTRIVLHEPGTYPDPIGNGKNLETGKYTEVKFQTQEWNRQDTPKHSCWQKTPSKNYTYHGSTFQYTVDRCINEEYARVIKENCSCLSAHFPMDDGHKTKDLPYCHQMDSNEVTETCNRLKCYQRVYNQVVKMETPLCKSRCKYFTYEVHASMSHWIAANWQLYWLKKLNHAWAKLTSIESLTIIHEFLNNSDSIVPVNLVTDPDENVFFVVNRNNFLVHVKIETLSVTASALISQIGGLSSLTIGITFATLFEIVEFIYLFRNRKQQLDRPVGNKNGEIKETQTLNNMEMCSSQ